MVLRFKLVPASVLLATGFAGFLTPFACSNSVDEQRGNVGQLCFEDEQQPCLPGLTCVQLPVEGGGYDGGECFDIVDASEGTTAATEDAYANAVPADALETGVGEGDGVGGDAALGSDAPKFALDASIELAEDGLASESSVDATAE
jgi:hypothetical protein